MALLKGLITRLGEIVKKKYFQNQEVGLLHQPSPLNELSLSAAPILGPPSSHSPCSTYLNLNRFSIQRLLVRLISSLKPFPTTTHKLSALSNSLCTFHLCPAVWADGGIFGFYKYALLWKLCKQTFFVFLWMACCLIDCFWPCDSF